MWPLACLALACSASGCSPPKANPSTVALERLLYSLRAGDLSGLWAGLSPESRAWLLTQSELSHSPALLNADEPPEPLKEALSLQPNWRFERSWGEQVSAEDQGSSNGVGRWFQFTDHAQRWRVHGSPQGATWRFDLFHASRAPRSQAP